ncbi:HgNV_033 [Dikerogammarus haemobaphes nudivirus]|nr:HgNV_033 [Dikerogammarus haemobaphes nudivirus]
MFKKPSRQKHCETSNDIIQSLHALKYDTFESYVQNIITSSLPASTFQKLNANPHEWDDAYIKFLLNVYAHLIEVQYFDVSFVDTILIEPIVLYVNASSKISENPMITHTISKLLIKKFIGTINNYSVECNKNRIEFTPPQVFTRSTVDYTLQEEPKLSSSLTNILIRLYLIAEHAAYHYFRFIESKNCDYKHEFITEKFTTKRPTQFYQLITPTPNKKYSRFTTPHQIIRRDDSEHSDGYINDFENLFKTHPQSSNTTESSSTTTDDSSSSEEDT